MIEKIKSSLEKLEEIKFEIWRHLYFKCKDKLNNELLKLQNEELIKSLSIELWQEEQDVRKAIDNFYKKTEDADKQQ